VNRSRSPSGDFLGPDHADATVAKEARDIFTQLGAQPFLNQLNTYVGDAWTDD
jgi:hypothetical protein